MRVIVDLCVIPLGVGLSLTEFIVACQKVLNEAGLKTHLHAYGTNVEGEWEEVMGAIKRCHELLHDSGVLRISTQIKLGTRTDKAQTMEDKVCSVESKLI